MGFRVQIVFWEDEIGSSPVRDFYLGLPVSHQAWIAQRNDHFEDLTWPELQRTPYLDPIRGINEKLYELKYLGKGGRNFRLVCAFWREEVIGLEMFAGSGSGGRVMRHVPIALERLSNWQERYP